VHQQGAAGAGDRRERECEPGEEDGAVETRQRPVEREREERERRRRRPDDDGAGKDRPERGHSRAEPRDAEGEKRRAAEERAGRSVLEPTRVRRDAGGEVLELEARDDGGEDERREPQPARRAKDAFEEELGAGDDEDEPGDKDGRAEHAPTIRPRRAGAAAPASCGR
jgi:hypothetical protein